MIFHIGLLSASLLGLVLSASMTVRFYRLQTFSKRSASAACGANASTCATVLQTTESGIAGIPNALIGAIYYGSMMVVGTLGIAYPSAILYRLALAASVLALLSSFYLGFLLLFRLRQSCPLCFVSHGLNTLIAALLILHSTGI